MLKISKKHLIQSIIIASVVTIGFQSATAAPTNAVYFDSSWTQFANDDGHVGPGGGDQLFDAEYLYYKLEGTKLSIGLQSGFDLIDGVVNYSRKDYFAGDLALSFDNDTTNGYEFAFDFGFETKDYYGNPVGGQPDNPGLYEVTSWNNDTGIYYSASNPFAMQAGTFKESGHTEAGPTLDGSYWRTVSFNLSSIGEFVALDAHWTMSCGNDTIDGHATPAPVPEPATMLLFGTGLAGLMGRVRKRKK